MTRIPDSLIGESLRRYMDVRVLIRAARPLLPTIAAPAVTDNLFSGSTTPVQAKRLPDSNPSLKIELVDTAVAVGGVVAVGGTDVAVGVPVGSGVVVVAVAVGGSVVIVAVAVGGIGVAVGVPVGGTAVGVGTPPAASN